MDRYEEAETAGLGSGPAAAARRGLWIPGRRPPDPTWQPVDGPLVQQLSGEVSDAGVLVHLQALQKIADENGGNRAAGTAGYEASVEYVVGVLRGAGFEVSTPTYEASGATMAGPGPVATSSPRPAPETRAGS